MQKLTQFLCSLTLLMTFALSAQASNGKLPPLETVKGVDLHSYVGKWYEFAMIPNSFQKKCVSNTTAEYEALANGQVKVVNTCTEKNGHLNVATGRAKILDKVNNSKLFVSFFKLFGHWVFWFGGDYCIIDLDSHYEWALIGNPSRKYGWILTRSPNLERSTLAKIAESLRAQSYDPCRFMTTVQVGGSAQRESICKLLE